MEEKSQPQLNDSRDTQIRSLKNSDKYKLDVLSALHGLTMAQAISKALEAYEEKYGKLPTREEGSSN